MINKSIRRKYAYMAIQAISIESQISINLLCEVAQLPRSSYYKWLNRKSSLKDQDDNQLVQAIARVYERYKGIFGYRRITLNLIRDTGRPINHKRVYRLMKLAGMQSVIRKKRKKHVRTSPQQIAENLLNRDFTSDRSNKKWLTDVTELKYGNGRKAYLSAILDLHDKTIVAYVLGHTNNYELVFKTLDLAMEAAPDTTPMLHSDRGFQYTSTQFKSKIDGYKMTQSMSRVGKCIDNGPMEGFWGILKSELYHLHKYNDFESLKADIDEYIYFYNYLRIQAKLNSLSPKEYRTKAA